MIYCKQNREEVKTMFEKLKRLGGWEKKMLFAVLDGIISFAVTFLLCIYATSSYWAQDTWVNVFFILLGVVLSAFIFWIITENEVDKNKPVYCFLISCGTWGALLLLSYVEFSDLPNIYYSLPDIVKPVLNPLYVPDAVQKLLLSFTLGLYASVAVLLRTAMTVLLMVRNRRILTEKIVLQQRSRYPISRLYVLLHYLPLLLGCLYLFVLCINRAIDARGLASLAIIIAVVIGFAGGEMSRYAELHDTYIRFYAFRFVSFRSAKTVHVRYADIFSIDAKCIGKKILYLQLRCHGFKHTIRLPFVFLHHKQLYAQIYNEVVRANSDVFISEELKELLASYQQKP